MTKIKKSKTIAYLTSTIGCSVASALVSIFGGHCGLFYVVCWAIFGASLGATASRLILHLSYKDYSAEMFQITIYQTIAVAAWIGAIFSETWGWTSFSMAVIVAMVMMALGTRFIKEHGETLKQICILADLEKTAKYFPKNDEPNAEDDLTRPLCMVEGEVLTIEEAEELGYVELADKARHDIALIYGIDPSESYAEKIVPVEETETTEEVKE